HLSPRLVLSLLLHSTICHTLRSLLFPYTTLFRSAFPDVVVMLFGLNEQNIEGTATVARHIREADLERPPQLHFVATPIPNLPPRSEEHTSELQSRVDLVCRLLLEKKN